MNQEYETQKYRFTSAHIERFIYTLVDIRNAAAHDVFLFGIKCRSSSRYHTELHNGYGIHKSHSRQDLFNAYIACKPFLTHDAFVVFSNTIRKRVNTLNKNLLTIDINTILEEMGFGKSCYIES